MLKFCNDNKGAISVFLTLILLPTLLLGGLTTDAARIYASKVVISDAGEMAMNAALAQYDLPLLDEYGLFAMEDKPSSMKDDLENCFEASLNGSGLVEEDYDKILDLVTEKFEVINLEASKLYQTDVEKQQIVEYMKYRAPICLTEILLEKLEILKETKQITKATEAQLDFADAMDDCQDAMEDAKKALDNLNNVLESFPSQTQLNQDLGDMEYYYRDTLAKCMLMIAAASKYRETTDIDGIEAAKNYVQAAKGLDLGNSMSESVFESYLSCKYYYESAKKLDNIITEKENAEPDPKDTVAHDAWEAELEELKLLQTEYNSAKNIVDGYISALMGVANECIRTHTAIATGHYDKAKLGKDYAETALTKLRKVQRKLQKAKDKWEDWSDATEAISGSSDAIQDAKEGMQSSVSEYEEFFGASGTQENQNNLNNLQVLIEAVEADQLYFQEIIKILEGISYHGCIIVTTSAASQYSCYVNKAKGMVGTSAHYSEVSSLLSTFQAEYKVLYPVETSLAMYRISSDPFYLKLKEYCENVSEGDAQAEKDEANQNLSAGKSASDDAKKEDESFPKYQWEKNDNLPSVRLAKAAEEAEELASISGEGNVGGKRKKALKDAKESISNAANFLTQLDNIISEGATNLYIAEYAMQMFSYYTVNKQVVDGNVQTISADQVVSLSGHVMSDRPAYRAEVEYILWGNESSQANISNTFMTIFGIRLLLNSIFAFTNTTIVSNANGMATTIAGAAPYLIPIIQAIIQFGICCVETADDIKDLKEGYGVTLLKDPKTWETYPTDMGGTRTGNNTEGFTMDYSEYLRIFLNVNMLGSLEATKLARIADCIQVDTQMDITEAYTMLAINANVKARTTFMKKITNDGRGGWVSSDDKYSIQYQSVLGY